MDIRNYINGKKKVNYLIGQLTPLIEKTNCKVTTAPFDDIDLELFLEEYAVAVGLDEIKDLIRNEWERRKSLYDEVTDEGAREFAISALKERFFNDSTTLFKGESLYASAMDWLDEQYTLLCIPLDEFGGESIFMCFDFTKAKFDVETFIDSDWRWYDGSVYRVIDNLKKNC